jgi:catechol 2,3-dioxygenase-like lactoylglutathione lyase family enzyme
METGMHSRGVDASSTDAREATRSAKRWTAGDTRPLDSQAAPRLGGILEAAIYGSDLDALEQFYVDVFGMEPIAHTAGRNTMLRCGHSVIILFDPARTIQPGGTIPPHGAEGPGHIALIASDDDIGAWRAHFARCGVPIEREIDWPEAGTSLYVRDPAGNSIEIAPASLWGGVGRPLLHED